jgi:transposase
MPHRQPPPRPTYDELAALVAAQAARIEDLELTQATLQARLAGLAQVNATLAARLAELERRLGQTSATSHRPPSSDGPRKPPRPAQPRQPGARRPGKQPGAPGAHLAQVADPDELVVHRPEWCDGCGATLLLAPVTGTQTRQVADLPEVRLRTVEHRAERRRCGCGHQTTASFPPVARGVACYGPRLRGLVAYLCAYQHLPIDRAARLLADVLGAPVATGTLATVLTEGAAGLDGFLTAVTAQLTHAPVAHFDETGTRVAGGLAWVHTACTQRVTLLSVHAKRGTEAMDAAGVLGAFAGVAVHDGWAPYRTYTQATHALCNAHHLRELDAVADEPGQGWAGAMAEWLSMAKTHVDQATTAGVTRLAAADLAGWLARYDQIVAAGIAANPPPPAPPSGRRPKRTPAACLLDRLARYRDQVTRFLTDLHVPFDNNQAERDIRMVKLQHKISGCWRTMAGAEAFLRLRSYIATAHKHGHNPLAVLCQLYEGNPWLPAST